MPISRTALALASAIVITGCTRDVTGPSPDDVPDIRSFVVDSALLALDANGQFPANQDVTPSADNVPMITSLRARTLAGACVVSFGSAFLPWWTSQRGAPIALGHLTISSIYPEQTPFGPLPPVGCHHAYAREYGSHYLTTLNDGATADALLAVSAQTTDYGIDADGPLILPPRGGADFDTYGISSAAQPRVWYAPEQAVALVSALTAAKIRSVPTLSLRAGYSPLSPLWRLDLDRSVVFLGVSGERLPSSRIYVATNGELFTPEPVQPGTVSLVCTRIDESLINHGDTTISVSVLPGQPVEFRAVTVAR